MLKKLLWGGALLAAASVGVLLLPQESHAQRFGRGGFGRGGFGGYGGNYGGWGGSGLGFGNYGMGYGGYGLGYGSGWNNWGSGYSPYYAGSAHSPYYGYNSGWNNWGSGYSPYYSNYTYPSYGQSWQGSVNYDYNTPGLASAPSLGANSSYQSFYPPQNNAAHVTVRLPDPNAELWFNNVPLSERGTMREFNTPPLDPSGQDYSYTVRAQWRQGNEPVTRTSTVHVRPGERVLVDFTQGQSDTRSPGVREEAQPETPAPSQVNRPAATVPPGPAPNPQPENLNVNPTPTRGIPAGTNAPVPPTNNNRRPVDRP